MKFRESSKMLYNKENKTPNRKDISIVKLHILTTEMSFLNSVCIVKTIVDKKNNMK